MEKEVKKKRWFARMPLECQNAGMVQSRQSWQSSNAGM